jgi:hypothetical protein
MTTGKGRFPSIDALRGLLLLAWFDRLRISKAAHRDWWWLSYI